MILLQDHGDKHSLAIKQILDQQKLIQLLGELQFHVNKLHNYLLKEVHQQIKLILELLSMEEDLN